MKLPLLCLLLFALIAVPIAAQPPARNSAVDERVIAHCIHRSARGKPWLEKVLWGIRHQEGGWIGAEVRNSDGSFDLGPMQINSWWVPRLARLLSRSPRRVWPWLRQDACFNVEAAHWMLSVELARSRSLWLAIGRYHSPKSPQQRNYILAVAGKIKRQ